MTSFNAEIKIRSAGVCEIRNHLDGAGVLLVFSMSPIIYIYIYIYIHRMFSTSRPRSPHFKVGGKAPK